MGSILRRRRQPRHLAVVLAGALLLALTLSACQVPDPFVASSHTSSMSRPLVAPVASHHPAGWMTFTDPEYGFEISYPPTWTLLRGYDGSHITIASNNSSTLSPLVTTTKSSPAQALAQATPSPAMQTQQHMTVTTIQVAGQPALDVFAPYIPSSFQAPNSGRALAAARTIVLAVRNEAGTTNVYTFLAYLPTDKAGNMSAATAEDNQLVTQIVATFVLPGTIAPAPQG